MSSCLHCGSEVPADAGTEFCCRGCQGAYSLLNGLGLSSYYKRRTVDPSVRPLRPEDEAAVVDYEAHTRIDDQGQANLHLMVEGVHCAACIWLIESLLGRQPGVVSARVNMTTRRLALTWDPAQIDAETLVEPVLAVGYRLVPFDPARLTGEQQQREKELLRAMAVAGFAAGNVMLFSVSVWSGHYTGMEGATRDLFHWISALIAVPAVLYCIRPFARSAISALRARRSNMDVPITIGVTLATLMSLFETARHGEFAYFDSAVTLLFFLLIGRYLDSRARGRARSAAEHLLTLGATAVTVIDAQGRQSVIPAEKIEAGMVVLAAAGERIGVDGEIVDGESDCDTSLITGETVPVPVKPGERVFAGTLNITAPLRIRTLAVGESTLLAEIVRMMEIAEQGRARYVAIADRVARRYAPVVHATALATFLGWTFWIGAPWQQALLNAVAVLIITCPCALALAVPVVQVVATGRLLTGGVLVKSATAQERLAAADYVVFDKTGTLTLGRPELQPDTGWTADDLALAASLAATSRHPLAEALVRAAGDVPVAQGVAEIPGHGLQQGDVRLGRRGWAGPEAEDAEHVGPEMWLSRPGQPPVRFAFIDAPRPDASAVIAQLKAMGLEIELLSGDRAATVADVAQRVGIGRFSAQCSPGDKVARLEALAAEGRKVLMVGDGLNDAPALAAAHVSMSPATAVDISQTAADLVFQGARLAPVAEALIVSRRADRLVRQNFALALFYNLGAVPLAILGYVTPLIAAAAMSSSSVIVIINALRLARRKRA